MPPSTRDGTGPEARSSEARQERLRGRARVKAPMFLAHLDWAAQRVGPKALANLRGLSAAAAETVRRPPEPTEWVTFQTLVEVDRAIASLVPGPPERTFLHLGRHSAVSNLRGVYQSFAREEPHRFFEQCALLHRRFQDFGSARYEPTGLQSGRLMTEGYDEYSPVFCASGRGYYEGAVEMMGAPGPILCSESLCQCAGDPVCAFDLSW